MPTLTIQLPGHPPVEHILREDSISLGRAPANRIALGHASVSQTHATISRIGNDYFLQDLQSTNGTRLNGQSVREAQLHDRDILKLGEVTAIFELRSTGGTAATLAVLAATSNEPPSTQSSKSDTAVLSSKAKTSRLKTASPGPTNAPQPSAPTAPNRLTLPTSLFAGVLLAGLAGSLAWLLGDSISPQPAPPTLPPPAIHSVAQSNLPSAQVKPPLTNPLAVIAETTPPIIATHSPIPADPIPETETQNLPELLVMLRASDVNERRQAAEAISNLGTGATNALLNLRVALLQDSDPEVRMWLAFVLVKNRTYDLAAVPVLTLTLSNARSEFRQQACAALALIPHDEATKTNVVPALKIAATDEDEAVRKAALAALKAISPEDVSDN